ncbi:hypothetical protein EJ04DRAFT_139216 [Polyplosphaeria fusca]|uniref:Uncharacterized protein n=1 Tax=Polyplosphaeria fusca TaxID=682080 RepID=A0A9P4R2K4_9PLEO|nr:hypothetical protein EJ04DRAFT_139216 [Polyplosphaeria fusca]
MKIFSLQSVTTSASSGICLPKRYECSSGTLRDQPSLLKQHFSDFENIQFNNFFEIASKPAGNGDVGLFLTAARNGCIVVAEINKDREKTASDTRLSASEIMHQVWMMASITFDSTNEIRIIGSYASQLYPHAPPIATCPTAEMTFGYWSYG